MKIYDVIIIGSGPAGYTAGIYASRAAFDVLLFEGMQPGGQLTITNDIENFPGFPDGISGPVLMDEIKKQAEKFGVKCLANTITAVNFSERPFKVADQNNTTYLAKSIIIATGANARRLTDVREIQSEYIYWGCGISSCATCDGFFYRNKEVMVIGGGDTAMEDAIYLSKIASKVTIVHRRQGFRASAIMLQKAKSHKNIHFILDAEVDEFLGERNPKFKALTGVRLRNTQTNQLTEHRVDGVFLALGHTPNTALFKDILDIDENGYLLTKGSTTYTNIEGVFACGDVMDSVYMQAVSAAGTGCHAAIDCERWLNN